MSLASVKKCYRVAGHVVVEQVLTMITPRIVHEERYDRSSSTDESAEAYAAKVGTIYWKRFFSLLAGLIKSTKDG